MKSVLKKYSLFSRLLFLTLWGSTAVSLQASFIYSVNQPIPDGNLSGLADTRTLTNISSPIQKVTVMLDVVGSGSGAFNGDFYAYLSHGTNLAVLLNRPGRRPEDSTGYSDSGFSQVIFDDDALNGDVHRYRFALFGDETTPIMPWPSPLTGIWAPDARKALPYIVDVSTARTAFLNVFSGADANGDWTLFIADTESGNNGILYEWGLEVVLVPEPSTLALSGLGLAFLFWRYRRRNYLQS
jgi:subtilisin-like proprotein convertase family protein